MFKRIKAIPQLLLAFTLILIITASSTPPLSADDPEIVLDKPAIASASGVMSDLNFTATINVGEPLSGGQMTDGYVTVHVGQGWTQVSWLRGALSAISIPSVTVWGLAGAAAVMLMLFAWRLRQRRAR